MVDAHSHAFQRAIRGATHRRDTTGRDPTGAADPSSFWSWRDAMYAVANRLGPDEVYAVTHGAFAEMLAAGITCVGEFHYLHHRPDGGTYDDPNELSWQVVRAAADVGIRLRLLEVFYARAGAGQPPAPEQRRFCDRDVEAYLQRVDALRSQGVAVGIAPHSVRAVGLPELKVLADYANAYDLPLHIHLSEQPLENEQCHDEHGMTPAAVLTEAGALTRERGCTAVHAIFVDPDDRRRLRDQSVCACPTTEADLGDGIVPAADYLDVGTNLAVGSDSNAVIDLVMEARLLEMDERLRSGARLRLCDREGRLWPTLLAAATRGGATSLGWCDTLGTLAVGRPFDAVAIDLRDPFFAGIEPAHVLDALFASGTAAYVRHVLVGGVETV
jgi:formimidoylglutamate deiminase